MEIGRGGPFVFISYRRDDTSGYAGRLYDALVARFGPDDAFMDLRAIPPGADFRRHIDEAIAACRALIVLIGPRWLVASNESGQRRLEDPADYVRIEVEGALGRDILVVPVLVQGARMPAPADLPPSLRALVSRNALELSDARWQFDVGILVDVLTQLQESANGPQQTSTRVAEARETQARDAEASDAEARETASKADDAPPTLVGRDGELARIDAAFAAAKQGESRLLLVLGEAGIGKTALIRTAVARVRGADGRVLVGACLDIGDGGLPYLPIAEALRGLARVTTRTELQGLLGPARRDLASIVPQLEDGPRDQPRQQGPVELDPPSGARRARLFERFLGVLARLGGADGAIVVIEDVQWVDRATRDLVTFLARNLTSERILLILTCRDDTPPGHPTLTWLGELARTTGAERIDLRRLDRAEVELMVQILTGASPGPKLGARLWRRSEGNPLFLEEVLESERAGASNDGRNQGSLADILVARIAALSPQTRRVLEAISVAGRAVDETVAAALLGSDIHTVGDALREAIAARVLAPDGTRGYRFRHELLREVVERDLVRTERSAYHARFAGLLEEQPRLADSSPADAAAELAYHWIGAERPADAYRASIAAAEATEAVQAFGEAHEFYEHALREETMLAPSEWSQPAQRLAVRRRAADMADLAGEFDRAIVLTRQAIELVDLSVDPATAGLLHSRLGYLAWVTGDGHSSVTEHEEAVRLVPAHPTTAERARVLSGLAGALMGAGRWSESKVMSEAAITAAVETGTAPDEGRARNILGCDLVALGRVEDGIVQLRHAREIAQTAGPPELLIGVHHNLALNLAQADQLETALAEVTAGRLAARRAGLERRFGQDLAALTADVLLRLGRWADADIVTGEGLALAQPNWTTVYLATVRSRLQALRGDADEAAKGLAGIAEGDLDADLAAYVSQVRAELALATGRPETAGASVAEGLARLEGPANDIWAAPLLALGVRAAADQAGLGRDAGDATAVAVALETTRSLREEAVELAGRAATRSTRAWLALATAEASRAVSAPDPSAWRAAADLWDTVPDPHAAAYARYRQAEAAATHPSAATDVEGPLVSAARTAIALGARPLAAAIATLAASAGVQLPVAAAPDGVGTPIAAV